MSTVSENLRKARIAAGYRSAADAARALGIPYSSYASHENAASGIRAPSLQRYAAKFGTTVDALLGRPAGVLPGPSIITGLPVVGRIQAGAWYDTSLIDDDAELRTIPAARDSRFPNAMQYALEVVGDSMSEVVAEGEFAVCVDFAASGVELSPRQIVHIERRHGALVEATLKQVERRGGKWVLVPRSSNPKWQPVVLEGEPDDDGEVVVKGLVTGVYRPITLTL